MASSDEDEFLGFTADDISFHGSDLDSDLSVSDSESDEEDIPLQFLRPLSSLLGEKGGGDLAVPESATTTTTPDLTPRKWTKQLERVTVNTFQQQTGPVNILAADKKELDFLNLLFPGSFYEILSEQTNLYAQQCIVRKPDSNWKPVSKVEIKAFVGIHIFMSIVQLPCYKLYWSTDSLYRIPSVSNIMTRDRFSKILQYFHCNDSLSNPPKGQDGHDKLHHVRNIFDAVQQNLVNNYRPHRDVAVDEAMIPFRGRIGYRQYLPAKPCKFGVKVWELADSTNGYVYQMQVYTGKKDTGREVGLASRVVWDLTRLLSGNNHHVYMDNYFSSPSLFEDLLSDGIYAAGTCRVNRRGWPDGLFKNCIKKEKGTSKAYQKGNLVATSWYDNRQVNFLSTNSDPNITVQMKRRQKDGSRTDVPAPEVVGKYGENMNGVDHGDQLRMQYSTTRRSKKFWKYLFWFLFDTSLSCAFILMKESPNHALKSKTGKDKTRTQLEFRQNLARQLIGGYHQKRKHEVSTKDKCGKSHWPVPMPKSRRCKLCQTKKVRKESKYGCKICDVNLCVECFESYHLEVYTEE